MMKKSFLRSPWKKKEFAAAEISPASEYDDDEEEVSPAPTVLEFAKYGTHKHRPGTPSASSRSSTTDDVKSSLRLSLSALIRNPTKSVPPGLDNALRNRADSPALSFHSLSRSSHKSNNLSGEQSWEELRGTRQRSRSLASRSARTPSRQSHIGVSPPVVNLVAGPPRKSSMAFVPPPIPKRKISRKHMDESESLRRPTTSSTADSHFSHFSHFSSSESPAPDDRALHRGRSSVVGVNVNGPAGQRASSTPNLELSLPDTPDNPLPSITHLAPENNRAPLRLTLSNIDLTSSFNSAFISPPSQQDDNNSSDDDNTEELDLSMSFLFPNPPPLSPLQLAALPPNIAKDNSARIPEPLPTPIPVAVQVPAVQVPVLHTSKSLPFKLGLPPKPERRATQPTPHSILKKASSSSMRLRNSLPTLMSSTSAPSTPPVPSTPVSLLDSPVSPWWPAPHSADALTSEYRKSTASQVTLHTAEGRSQLHMHLSSNDFLNPGRSPILVSYPRSPTTGTFYTPPSPRQIEPPSIVSPPVEIPRAVAL